MGKWPTFVYLWNEMTDRYTPEKLYNPSRVEAGEISTTFRWALHKGYKNYDAI